MRKTETLTIEEWKMIDAADAEAKKGALWNEKMPSGISYKITKTMRKAMKGKVTLLLHATGPGYGGKVIQATQIVLPTGCSCQDVEKGMEIVEVTVVVE